VRNGDAAAGRKARIAHAQQGISKVYDLHRYRDEKRDALTLGRRAFREVVD
jgi:hypothetical protein